MQIPSRPPACMRSAGGLVCAVAPIDRHMTARKIRTHQRASAVHTDGLAARIIKNTIPRVDCGSAVDAIESPRLLRGDLYLRHLMNQAAFRAGKNHCCHKFAIWPVRNGV